jgi:DNA-binding response OmpR family regulator
MVTAVSEVEIAVEAIRLGPNDYVIKPFVLHDMLRTVDSAISEETDKVIEIPMPDVDASQAPMTIAVRTPAEEVPEPGPGAMNYDIEFMALAEDVEAAYEQIAALKSVDG